MEQKLIRRQADFESKFADGLRAWVNQTKDGLRTYLVVMDKDGNKLFLNKVEASASPSLIEEQEAHDRIEFAKRYEVI